MSSKPYKTLVVWLRRDLRVHDNASLHAACLQAEHVIPLFVLDDAILTRADTGAARVAFLLDALRVLDGNLQKRGSRLIVRRGKTPRTLVQAVREFGADAVFHHAEHEPFGVARDAAVHKELDALGIACETFKDIGLFEGDDILSGGGTPFSVFSPYKRQWLSRPADAPHPAPAHIPTPPDIKSDGLPSADALKFRTPQQFDCGGEDAGRELLHHFVRHKMTEYAAQRDILSADGTSRLSRHLHLGTLGMREVLKAVRDAPVPGGPAPKSGEAQAEHQSGSAGGRESFLNEMAWHDFYLQILHHFPHVADGAFRPQFNSIKWENSDALFAAWKEGRTGYPIVDAAMRQLNAEAWMHNRGRMIVASFLTKDLLIDWRWGEAYFMQQLVDGDQAANNGGWQWAAGTGNDAQPFFRIFNPTLQGEKFDPDGAYVKRWVPELTNVPAKHIHAPWKLSPSEREHLGAADYPAPIVDHAVQRQKALALYEKAAKK